MPFALRPSGLPRAHRWESYYCGQCPNAHLIFFDTTNVPICEATFSAQQCDRLATSIRKRDPNYRTPTGGEMER